MNSDSQLRPSPGAERDLLRIPTSGTVYDLTEVNKALARLPEISHVTQTTAPELLMSFNRAYLEAEQISAGVELNLSMASRDLDKVHSIVLLDKVPEYLKSKGMSTAKSPMGSEDIRKAIIDADPEYQRACDALDQLKAVSKLIKSKAKGLEMAYSTVKRLVSEGSYNWGGQGNSKAAEQPGLSSSGAGGFGKAKY